MLEMPAERKVPDKETLTKWWVDDDMGRQEIVDRWFLQTGVRVTLPAISNAVREYGLPRKRNRWDEFLPWHVAHRHDTAKEAVLLRVLARRRAGLSNPGSRETWADSWLEELEAAGRPVITYYADTEEGFHYVPRVPEDGDGEWDLIRKPEVQEMLDQREAV